MGQLKVLGDPIVCRAVVFDKDGTLIDHHLVLESLFRSRLQAFTRFLGKESENDFARICGYDLKTGKIDPWGPLNTASRKEEEILCAGLIFEKGIPFPSAREMASKIFQEAEDSLDIEAHLRPLPHAEELLRELDSKGFLIALATGDGSLRAERMMSLLNWGRYFDLILGVDEVESPKPNPDFILKCSQRLGVLPQDMVVVGDSCLDALMGKNAGVAKTIGVLTGTGSKEKLEECFDIVVPDLSFIKVE